MRQYQVMVHVDGEWQRECTLTACNREHAAEKVAEWGLDCPYKIVCL
jgi:hypothetical protein